MRRISGIGATLSLATAFEMSALSAVSTQEAPPTSCGGEFWRRPKFFIDSIGKSRTDIFLDPRVFIGNIITNQAVPTTHRNSWALCYNAHQHIQGDEQQGWGPFLRTGANVDS